MTSANGGPLDAVLRALLADAGCLLLDFDGPVCRLFSGRPAHLIADEMRGFLARRGHHSPADAEILSSDPHRVLQAMGGHELASGLESLLAEEEDLAARTAEPTPGADAFIRAAADSGRLLAVTTNNAPLAVESYLEVHGLAGPFGGRIFGRSTKDPALMKPHPDCLLRAMAALAVSPEDCLMIGDSAADAGAAEAAGVRFLGYARSAERAARLRTVAPHPVVVGMPVLVAAIRPDSPPNE